MPDIRTVRVDGRGRPVVQPTPTAAPTGQYVGVDPLSVAPPSVAAVFVEGPMGPPGPKGDRGERGYQGTVGPPGPPGPAVTVDDATLDGGNF